MKLNKENCIIDKSSDDKINFSEFKSLYQPVVKTYDSDGKKIISANMSISNYQSLYTNSLENFDQYIQQVNQHTTMTLGVTKEINGICKTAKKFREEGNCIYRGKEHVKFYNDIYPLQEKHYSLIFFDIDYSDDVPIHFKYETAEDVRNSLIKILPIFEHMMMLIKPSSSSNIYNTDTKEYRSEEKSWHVFCVVNGHTTETNEIFKELLWRRVWSDDVNFGYIKIDKGSSVLNRNYIDMAVLSSERIIAIAKVITQIPYIKYHEDSVIYDGGILDLTKINLEDEDDYRDKFEYQKSLIISSRDKNSNSISTKNKLLNKPRTIQTNSFNGEVMISEDTKEKILSIYSCFQNINNAKYQNIKEYINDGVVVAVLTFLGFEITSNLKFKMRDENTPSSSINFDGYIKDFGGSFSGNIISFLMEMYQLGFIESWKYFKSCFGVDQKLNKKTMVALPDSKIFEQSLTIINSIQGE